MKILLATDGSDGASAAVDFLLDFPFPPDSSVTVLTVIDDLDSRDRVMQGLSEEQSRSLRAATRLVHEEAEQLLVGQADRLRNAGWKGDTDLRYGKPTEQIVLAAEQHESDLVVLGSHGLSGIRHFLLGGVTDRVLEYAPCSVLVVKKPVTATEAVDVNAGETDAVPWRIMLAYDNSEPARQALGLCASLPLENKAQVVAITVLSLVTGYPATHESGLAAQEAGC